MESDSPSNLPEPNAKKTFGINYIKENINSLYQDIDAQFNEDVSGQALVKDFTTGIDEIIRALWELHEIPPELSLLASGGYGRGELYPYSDIDLIILLPEEDEYDLTKVEQFLQALWDLRFDVGSNVLKVTDITHVCDAIETYTSFSEHRYIAGSKKLYKAFTDAFTGLDSWSESRFFEHKLIEQNERHAAYKNTIYNLEPNIKEAPGGLRDIHTILWLAKRTHKTRDLPKLVKAKVLTAEESRLLKRSHTFLKQLRVGLHLVAKRKEDRLLFDHQNTLAKKLGYQDRKGFLAVEQLMRRYYQSAMTITMLNNNVLQELADDMRQESLIVIKIDNRFTQINNRIGIIDVDVFERDSNNLFALFIIFAETPNIVGLRPRAVRAIRAYIKSINKEFRENEDHKAAFLELFDHPEGLYLALKELNNLGVLARFIPAFAQIVGRMQYDLFHAYTVDAHTLFVIRNLCDVITEEDQEVTELIGIARHIKKPNLLLLAAFFHDIAKGRGGSHSEKGAKDARQFGLSFGLSNYDTSLIQWLVLHHLDMSTTAQRMDISDPEVIERFANLVGDKEHLDYLYLLTVADIRATSLTLWNGWKRQLLLELYQSTSRQLKLSIDSNIEHPNRIQSRKNDVLNLLSVDEYKAEKLWRVMREDYFTRTDVLTIAWHTNSIVKASAGVIPVIDIVPIDYGNTYQLMVYAPDVEVQLPLVTSALNLQMLNIADARIFRLKNNMILMNFVIIDQDGSHLGSAEAYPGLIERMVRHIQAGALPKRINAGRSHAKHKYFDSPTKITINSNLGRNPVTVIELDTLDQPGLLYRVFKVIYEMRLRLVSARISTLGERVEDVFFVTDRDGEIIEDEKQIATIKQALLDGLSSPLT